MPGAKGEVAPGMRDLYGMRKWQLINMIAKLRIENRLLHELLEAQRMGIVRLHPLEGGDLVVTSPATDAPENGNRSV